MKVVVRGAKRQRVYQLTPHRKHAGKAIACKSMKKLASECVKNKKTRQYN